MNLVIGIDPDAEKHGVAVYSNGKLVELCRYSLLELISLIKKCNKEQYDPLFSIEDVCANDFVYGRNSNNNRNVLCNIAKKVGACQQAQIELMRALDHYGIRYKKHPPKRGNWAKNKPAFQKATGWTGKSNEDTRSAAFFGFLELH